MKSRLPPSVVEADRTLLGILRRVHFSRYLNPVNAEEAREAWRSGAPYPPFRYLPADWADEVLRELDDVAPEPGHPFAEVLLRAAEGLRLLSLALRDRTAERFDALARFEGWYPGSDELGAAAAERPARDTERVSVPADAMIRALRAALDERGLASWRVVEDAVMSARVLVDGAKRVIRVHPGAWFRRRDRVRLVAHEVDVHVLRSEAGRRQPLELFAAGLPGALEVEEGLALLAEELSGAASPGQGWRTGLTVLAIPVAREAGFEEVVRFLRERGAGGVAWGIALRLKRGLARPDQPGVYAKDVVYHRGARRVRAWLRAGGSVDHLYVGKVSLDDPVDRWLAEGLVTPGRAPPVFSRPG